MLGGALWVLIQNSARQLFCLPWFGISISPTQSPLAFSREQQFPPNPDCSGMFQKSSFNVRIHLQPLNGGVGLEPGPV